jgi:hypothetical protein
MGVPSTLHHCSTPYTRVPHIQQLTMVITYLDANRIRPG